MKEKQILAVIDTNVIVSALLNHDGESNPSIVLTNVISGSIIPLYNEEILSEYREVLSRDKWFFRNLVESILIIDIVILYCRVRVNLPIHRKIN